MKNLRQVGVWLFVLTAIGWGSGLVAQGTTDTGSTTMTLDELGLTGTNVMAFGSLTDPQLEALLNILDATPTIIPAELPQNGTFWSLRNPDQPPFPGDLSRAPAWQLQDGSFLLDDKTTKANVFTKGSRGSKVSDGTGTVEADALTGPPGFNDTNSVGTNVETSDVSPLNFIPYGTNLYLAQEKVANGYLTAIASNTTPGGDYTILWETNLLSNNWQVEGTVVGSVLTNWTTWSMPQGSWSNLFVQLRSEISSDDSGIPDWWERLYFGTNTVNPDAQDSAGDGYTIYQKYTLGVPPGKWLTPPAPSGFSVSYNYTKGTVVLTWNKAQGAVSNYIVSRWNPNDGTSLKTTLSSNVTSMVDTSPITIFPPENGDPFYALAAAYSNGVSASVSLPMFDPSTTVSAQMIPNVQNQEQLVVQGAIPTGTTALLLTSSDFDITEGVYWEAQFTLPISSLNNNSAVLPNTWINSFAMAEGDEDWYAQAVNSNGHVSDMTEAGSLTWHNQIQLNPTPFLDGRQQMVQNEMFILRVANAYNPFFYQYWPTSGRIFYPSYGDYSFSGLYDVSVLSPDEETQTSPYLDPLRPFAENYFFHNFVFSTNDIDPATGDLTTGLEMEYLDGLTPVVVGAGTYQFIDSTNRTIPAILSPAQSQWTCFYPQTEYQDDLYDQAGMSYYGVSGSAGDYSLSTTESNYFGLQYLSARFTYTTNGTLEMPILAAGGSITNVIGGGFFSQTAVPQLKTVDYYFAQPQSYLLPGQYGFSPGLPDYTNDLVAGFGQQNLFAGYAIQELLNGYQGTYSYLGQYFDKVYQMDTNGNVTTNSGGTITPYGELFPTTVGPVALVTMTNWGENARGTGVVQVVKLVLDVNHDGAMDLSFNGPDNTSPSSPYVFWANNNFDRWATNYGVISPWMTTWTNVSPTFDGVPIADVYFQDIEQDDKQIATCPAAPRTPTPDCNYVAVDGSGNWYRAMPSTRDLEDFARLWVCGLNTNVLAALPAGSTVALSWGDVGTPDSSNPTIDLFTAADATGGIGYQTNETVATLQTNVNEYPYIGRLGPGQSIALSSLDPNGNPTWLGNYFVWCGVSNGIGGLTLTIQDSYGNTLAQTKTYIQIVDIKQMYERWTIGDNQSLLPTNTASLATDYPTNSMNYPFQYASPDSTNTPYILFVHGYNLSLWQKNTFAETAFKRLYWQGYQGRFGALRWPTTVQTLTYPGAFDDSEFHAWSSGTGLLNLLTNLNAIYPNNVYLMAHSHGNIVASEALRLATAKGLGPVVNTYIAMQAAVDSHAYDTNAPQHTNSTFFTTPDCYAQYPASGDPCYFSGTSGAATCVNFFNTNDWALNRSWIIDQNRKPDTLYGYSASIGFYHGTDVAGYLVGSVLSFPTNTYSIFSYCDQGESFAAGMERNLGGIFSTPLQVELDVPPYNFGPLHSYHSGEFRSDNPQRWQFWNEAVVRMKLKN